MQIGDYVAEITIDETEILDWSGFQIASRIGQAQKSFSVELNRPTNIAPGSTISISDGFEGTLFPLIEDKEIERTDGSGLVSRFSGAGSRITRKAPSKTIVYVNKTWLDQVAPNTVFKNDIIYIQDPGSNPWKINDVSPYRLIIPGLPGKDIKDHEFECHLQAGITHHDIGRIIADECDLTLVVNTPNIPLQKTFVISSGQSWWEAIPRLFKKWNPQIFVRNGVLYIIDMGGDTQAKPGDGHVTLSEDSFSIYEWGKSNEDDVIDHVLINGPSTRYTYEIRTIDMEAPQRSAKELDGEEITIQTESRRIFKDEFFRYLWGCDNLAYMPVRRVTTHTKKIDSRNPANMVTIQSVMTEYNQSDDKISENTIDYSYADFRTPLGYTSTLYARIVRVAGGSTESVASGYYQDLVNHEWKKVKEEKAVYRDYLGLSGAVEVDIEIKELCGAYKTQETYEEGSYWAYAEMKPIWQLIRSNAAIHEEVEEGEGWVESWQLTTVKTIRYDKASEHHLIKTTDKLVFVPNIAVETYEEDIPLPGESKRSRPLEKRWEYFNVSGVTTLYEAGDTLPSGDFHPRVDFSDPDIVTEANAKKIADRMFAKNVTNNTRGTIETVLPIPVVMVGGTIGLPAFTKKYFDWDTRTYQTVTVDAKTYWIVGHVRVSKYEGDVGSPQRLLKTYDRIEIREYF